MGAIGKSERIEVKKFKGLILLLLVILITILPASALELTASTGDSGGSSSTHVVYGATIDDFANEHIQLNPEKGTLSNAFSGIGNLPYSSISITDGGKAVAAWREITGDPGYTSWSYNWGTDKSYISGFGNGVIAWLSMDVQNAYGIDAGSAAINDEGDCAAVTTQISSPTPTSTLRNYYTSANAYTPFVFAYQWASSGSSENAVAVGWSGGNHEGDKSWNYIADSGNSYWESPYNSAITGGNFAYTYESISSAYGSNYAQMFSQAENVGLANEYISWINGPIEQIPTFHGEADFVVRANELDNIQISTSATKDGVLIAPTLPAGTKTAIMLEPMKNAFAISGVTDLGTTVLPDLTLKGYATLRYTDSGATRERFQNLGQYDVVLVDSHMNSNGISLSSGTEWLPASQLNYQSSKNSLVILSGCESFAGHPTQKSALANAVGSAYLSGGFTQEISAEWGHDYLSYFFDSLSAGYPASYANTYANNLATGKWGSGQYLIPLVFYPTNMQHDFKL